MTVITSQIMKYYSNFFSQPKVNVTTPMKKLNIFLLYDNDLLLYDLLHKKIYHISSTYCLTEIFVLVFQT